MRDLVGFGANDDVAVHAVELSQMAAGDVVAVYGAGPIGVLTALVARHAGASAVVITEPSPWRREVAARLGFTVVAPDSTMAATLAPLTDGEGADTTFDSAAHPSVAADLAATTRVRGRIVVVGVYKQPTAIDLQAVCSGFVYALTVADSMIRAGAARCALVVGSEVFSRILDFNDRTTCVLFGDGAGAVVLEASTEPGILATELHADGRHVGILCVPGTVAGGHVLGDPLLKMDGPAVFKLAVGVLDSAARAVLEKAGRRAEDLDWLIPHQANIRIMQGTAKKLKLPLDKLIATVDEHGNTSAASVPLALDVAVRSGRVQRGHTVMLEGVGGGFTWGAVLLDF